MTSQGQRLQGDSGSVVVEAAFLVVPLMLMMWAFIHFVGRSANAEASVREAAQRSARAATLRDLPVDAERDARAVAAKNLEDAGVVCTGGLNVSVDTTALAPGGQAAVTVTCVAQYSDLMGVGIPGSRTFVSRSVQVVDTYRSPS